jgi:translocation and assembly module TamB
LKRMRDLPWLKWLKHLFVTAHFLLFSTIIFASVMLYIAFRPDGLHLVNTYFLKPLGIHYSHAEGSLLEGFTLHNFRSDTMEAQRVTLQYNLVTMLEGEHTIDSIKIDGVRLHLDDFISDETSIWPFPTFKLTDVAITNLQLMSAYPIELDIYGKNGTYDGSDLSFAMLNASLKSRYVSGAIKGTLRNNHLTGVADLYPNRSELAPYSGKFTELPRLLRVKIVELSNQKAALQTRIKTLTSKHDSSVRAETISLELNYLFDNDYLDIQGGYRLVRGNDSMEMKHHLRYAFDGVTTSEFEGVIDSSTPLPSSLLHGKFQDDPNGLSAEVILDGTALNFSTSDYDAYKWSFKSNHQNLTFLPSLPEAIRTEPIRLEGKGTFNLSLNALKGSMESVSDYARFKGEFSTQNTQHGLSGTLWLPRDASLWKNWSHKPPEELHLSLQNEHNATRLNLSGEALALTAVMIDDRLKGSGNYLGTYFDLSGTLNPNQSHIELETITPSLFATLGQLHPIELYKGEYYDAEVRTKTTVDFGNTLSIHSDIKIPWYAAVMDTQRAFGGTEGSATLEYRDGNITVHNYRMEVANHPIATDKTSYLHLNSSGDVVIDEFWIFDTLRLEGVIKKDLASSLHLYSERFKYKGPEGEAYASADIRYERDGSANQNLFGEVNILDATIIYLPLQEFKVMDDDIIIIQDVRPPSQAKLSMNLHVTARKPIHVKTKELDLRLNPDITLWKDPTEAMQILGMVSIPSGSATTSGKLFMIKPSEIYFGGDIPINPYLDLTIMHEVDYKKMFIFVTHTLDSPIFLFSSDPVMSQNDIMSYILFGGSANTVSGGTEGSSSSVRADATNFMLGAGLKGLINGATKLQIDTMNILTTAEGGMGFEVGARLNKDLRVLYKNDTVSSVLVQYSVNRWLRLDADIHELGQGINAIYIKDFRDFLPHNLPKKK